MVVAVAVAAACSAGPGPVAVADLGGDGTVRELRGRPFHQPVRSLSGTATLRFNAGADSFDALGCLACHRDATRPTRVSPSAPAAGVVGFAGLGTSLRVGPSMIGLGALQAVPVSWLIDQAKRQAADGVVSGRVVWVDTDSGPQVGRFGWKASEPTVASQTRRALDRDLGRSDVTGAEFDRLVFYSSTVGVPAARSVDDPTVRAGAKVFERIGCAACHSPSVPTGQAIVAAWSNQTIHPYTDLLVHDLGAGLADESADGDPVSADSRAAAAVSSPPGTAGGPSGLATRSEWRTAALWGLGMRAQATGDLRLLHDGRARSIPDAIDAHGGEAAGSARAYRRLSGQDRARLLAFLESL